MDPGNDSQATMDPGKDGTEVSMDQGNSGTEAGSEAGLRCTQCTRVFEDVLALLAHLDSHSAQCSVCKKDFTSQEFLNHHMKSHNDETTATTEESSAADVPNTDDGQAAEMANNGNIEEMTIPDGAAETNKMSVSADQTDMLPAETNGSESQDEVLERMVDTGNALDNGEASLKHLEAEEALPNGGEDSIIMDKEKDNNVDSNTSSPAPKADKPYRCSKCKYAAKSVASVNMHQRRQHPGEWATVISTLDDTEIQPNQKEPSEKDQDEAEDKEVSLALKSPLPASDSEDGEEEDGSKPSEYRCSMCNFTAQDTDTVFEHQREKHPVEWEPSPEMLSPEHKEGEMNMNAAGEMNPMGEEGEIEDQDQMEPMYELPTELDHYSSMGRSIIAGSNAQGLTNNNSANPNIQAANAALNVNNSGFSTVTGKYHCSNCPAYFYEMGQLRRHHQMCVSTETLNSNLAQYRCCLCKRVFPDKNSLLPHMLNHQRNFPRYRCSICAYKGKFEGTIIAHINHRHPGEPSAYVEKIAGQDDVDAITTFWERIGPVGKEGDIEAEDVTDDPDLQQLFSGVSQNMSSFSQRNDSLPGISPHEAGADSGTGAVEMDSQSQTSELSDDSVVETTQQWSPESLNSLKFGNNYMCPECPVLFREAYKLKRHMESHGGVKRHICKICGKGFTRSEHLRRHRVVHANTKPYMCSTCGYSAKRLDNLQKHQRTKHLGEPCEIIRVSKEMIEAEIAANETARGIAPTEPPPPPMPRPQIVVTPQQPQPMMMPMKAKRGRPRKISSPQDNFMFCRDPNFVPSRHPSSFSMRNSMNNNNGGNLSNPLQNANGIHSDVSMNLTSGGNLSYNTGAGNPLHMNYSSPQPGTSFYPYPMFGSPNMSSTPVKMPGFDLSQITAAAAAAVMPNQNNSDHPPEGGEYKVKAEPTDNKLPPGGDSEVVSDSKAHLLASLSHISGLEKAAAALATMTNRGKYQCHVCDRPFSYLKPFKKHLLCHGTFMPYECSKCGHQSKRRDMIQDHQRDAHPGEACEIHVNEPTSDMHDMMDTYIQQVPEQRPPQPELAPRPAMPAEGSPMQPAGMKPQGTPGNLSATPGSISEIDRSMVDPQLNFPLGLVKIEPIGSQSEQDSATSSPQPAAVKPPSAPPSPAQTQNKPKHELIIRTRRQLSKEIAADAASSGQVPAAPSIPQNQKPNTAVQPPIAAADIKSERSTSSPVVFSQLSSAEPGLARPRARRANLIKFKVLSPHTKTVARPLQPEVQQDNDSRDDSQPAIADLPVTENINDNMTTTNVTPTNMSFENMPEMKNEDDESCGESAVKRRRLDESLEPGPSSTEIKEEKMDEFPVDPVMLQSFSVHAPLIGKAPKVPIMGAKVGKPLHPAAEALVVNIKSHKGSPKEKQGDNHKFVCSVCEQRFAYEKPFKRHLLVHGGFQPYKCNVCGHLTTSRDSMKVHQHKVHSNQKGLGITVLEPTPEMEQSLIRQGLLQQYVSEDEENPATKSIVETARMEQHKMAAAMKSLSASVKKQGDNNNPEVKTEDTEQQSFPMVLGLRPANSGKADSKTEQGETSGNAANNKMSADGVPIYDELSDMPVDDAIFNLQGQSRMIIEPKGEGFKCQFCGKSFQCSSKMQRHMISHTGIKAYECQICFKKLTRLEHLKRHLLTHGNIKPYRCSACKFDAKRLDIVQLHQQMTHAGEAVEIVYLFTPSVIETAANAGLVLDESLSEEGNFACDPCGLSFTSMSDLMTHQKSHATSKPYVCFVCDKSFTRPEHLKRHRLVHDDTKPYRCSECGFKTKRLDGMREHQRSRHPESPVFIIDTVLPENPTVKRQRGRPPKFGRRDSLEGLQLMHCDKCCLAFYDQNRFEQHKIMHIPSPTKPQDLTCPVCGLRLSLPKHLRRHMLLHESHIPYQCSLCGYSAKRTDHMKLHFRKQHPDGGAQIIFIAKDNFTGQTAAPMILSDNDSYNDGSSSLGNDSFFDDYADGEIEEADLTLEQLTAMAHDQAAQRGSSEDEEEEYMNSVAAYGEGIKTEGDGTEGMPSGGLLMAGEEEGPEDMGDESNGQVMEGVEENSDMVWGSAPEEATVAAQPTDADSINPNEQVDNAEQVNNAEQVDNAEMPEDDSAKD